MSTSPSSWQILQRHVLSKTGSPNNHPPRPRLPDLPPTLSDHQTSYSSNDQILIPSGLSVSEVLTSSFSCSRMFHMCHASLLICIQNTSKHIKTEDFSSSGLKKSKLILLVWYVTHPAQLPHLHPQAKNGILPWEVLSANPLATLTQRHLELAKESSLTPTIPHGRYSRKYLPFFNCVEGDQS